MKVSLKERLVAYLMKYHINDGFIASGELQRIVAQKTSYTPRTVVRRLEELATDGKLEVKYIKGHAWYRTRIAPEAPKLPQDAMSVSKQIQASIEWFNGLPA